MRRAIALLATLLATACSQFPVNEEVRIEFARDDRVVEVTAETTFTLQPRSEAVAARVEAARSAAQAGMDPWAIRFARLSPETERVSVQKKRGKIESVTRSVLVPFDDLQQIFADTNVTVNIVEGEGWNELRFYPGSGSRATREQERAFASDLAAWSGSVARYVAAVHRLYAYLDENPARAEPLFAVLFEEQKEPEGMPVTDDAQAEDANGQDPPPWQDNPLIRRVEVPLLEDLAQTMTEIFERRDAQEGRASSFAEDADLIFNPFPGRIVVRVPGEILETEGFTTEKDAVIIERIDLLEAISALEGTWVSPDPLTLLLREERVSGAELASQPRKSRAFVPASEVAATIRRQLERPKTYVVRWRV